MCDFIDKLIPVLFAFLSGYLLAAYGLIRRKQ